jgi:sugar diacid utilization regulator
MIDILTAPAMATQFTTFAELVQTNGLRNTATALQIQPRTVHFRINKPGSFTLLELLRLSEVADAELGQVLTQLAQAVEGDPTASKAQPRSATVEVASNALVIRMNPEVMSPDELATVARLSGSDLATLTSQVAAQKAKKAGQPTTIAELIHGLGGRYETAPLLGISPNTLAARMKKPESFTLAELIAVARVTNTDLLTVVKLAQYQHENRIAPPSAELGRPPLNH